MSVALADLGAPLGHGRTSEVYAWPPDQRLVVKLFLAAVPAEHIATEQAVCHEVVRMGVTPVRCHGTVVVDGRTGLLFDRLTGNSLTRIGQRNPLRVRRTATTLARVQHALHAPPTQLASDVRGAAIAALDTPPLAFLDAAERARAAQLISALPPGERILHLDCHTDNLYAHAGGYAVIDWQTAQRGDPAADVAASVLLLRDAELWPGTPRVERLVIGLVRRVLLRAYLAEYQRLSGMTDAQIDAWRLVALVLRMASFDVDGERQRFRAEVRAILR